MSAKEHFRAEVCVDLQLLAVLVCKDSGLLGTLMQMAQSIGPRLYKADANWRSLRTLLLHMLGVACNPSKGARAEWAESAWMIIIPEPCLYGCL